MVADIDLAYPDARRVHVTEIARGLRRRGLQGRARLARAPIRASPGVRYVAAAGSDAGKAGRIVRVNAVAVARLVAGRRRARSLYVRYDWGVLPAILAGRALGYRVVLEVNALTTRRRPVPGVRLGTRARRRRARQARRGGRRVALGLPPAARHRAPARPPRRRLRRAARARRDRRQRRRHRALRTARSRRGRARASGSTPTTSTSSSWACWPGGTTSRP